MGDSKNVGLPAKVEEIEPLDERYYQRKCYIKSKSVPTQSVMKKYMKERLAKVYFGSMSRKLKELAGLEPVLAGGGASWFHAPEDLLRGALKLVPAHSALLANLRSEGIGLLGPTFLDNHRKEVDIQIQRRVAKSTRTWKEVVSARCDDVFSSECETHQREHTRQLKQALHEFELMYTTSIADLENILKEASVQSMKKIAYDTNKYLMEKYSEILKEQESMMRNRFAGKYRDFLQEMKDLFKFDVKKERAETYKMLHDIFIEKTSVAEQLREILESRNLACQLFVACKEKERFVDEILEMRKQHDEKMNELREQELFKDIEIELGKTKQQASHKLKAAWQHKICLIIKKFKLFVNYCLKTLPEQSKFFMNVEKILVSQMNSAFDNIKAENLLYCDEDDNKSDVMSVTSPLKHEPYIVVGDVKHRNVNETLCVRPRVPVSPDIDSRPVLVINDKFIYAACDKFKDFPNRIQLFLKQAKENQSCAEDLALEKVVKVKDGSHVDIVEREVETSLMKVLMSEIFDVLQVTPNLSCKCITASKPRATGSKTGRAERVMIDASPKVVPASSYDGFQVAYSGESMPSYFPCCCIIKDYVAPTQLPCGCLRRLQAMHATCQCPQAAMKTLKERLPPYMLRGSPFQPLIEHPYETCDRQDLQALTNKSPTVCSERIKQVDVAIQYIDFEYLELFQIQLGGADTSAVAEESADNVQCHDGKLVRPGFRVLGESMSYPYLFQSSTEFAQQRMESLARLLKSCPDLKSMFLKDRC